MINQLTYWLVSTFGYEKAMFLKHLCIYITGFSAGALIMYLIAMKIVLRYSNRYDMPDISVIKIKHENKNYFFANPSNIFEASYVFFLCFFLKDSKPYKRKDDASIKIKVFSIAFFVLLIISNLMGLILSLSISEQL